MLLFLDIISPLPEFCVFDDNKIILQQKITQSETDKLSDNIIQSYLEIDKRLNLTKNLTKISTTIGPGSYTSLRVGSAFVSGLMISRDIPYYPLSIEDILKFNSIKYSRRNLAVFVNSSNKQKFLCYKTKDNEIKYDKIENNKYSIPQHIDLILFNNSKINENNEIEQMKFSFFEDFYNNYNNLTFKKNIIIKPIYISNNQLLNWIELA